MRTLLSCVLILICSIVFTGASTESFVQWSNDVGIRTYHINIDTLPQMDDQVQRGIFATDAIEVS